MLILELLLQLSTDDWFYVWYIGLWIFSAFWLFKKLTYSQEYRVCCFKLVKTSFIATFVLFWNIYLFSFTFLNLNWNVVKLWDVILYFMKLVWILLFTDGMCYAALFCIEFFITKTIGQFLKPECVQRYNSENSSTQCVDV